MIVENFNNCKICEEDVVNDSHYYREHKITLADYFVKYFNRKDLYTGETLEFKNKEQYLAADFSNKNNLKKYIKEIHPDKARDYCVNLLKNRKNIKNLIYAPTQVELKSIISPTIITYNRLFPAGYYDLCNKLGFKQRFNCQTLKNPLLEPEIPKDAVIEVDTREQAVLKLKTDIEIKKLNFGDYYSKNYFNIYIERKSLNDFIGTFSQGLERFCRELDRAQKEKAYIVILVENTLNECANFNCLPWVSRRIKAKPDFILHNVRSILQKYLNCQFVFVDGRKEAVNLLEKIFFSGLDFRAFDIQLMRDLKLL